MTEQQPDVWITVTRVDPSMAPFIASHMTVVYPSGSSSDGQAVLQAEFNLTACIRHIVAETNR